MKFLHATFQSIWFQNGVILAGATLLALFNITHEPIWLDESYSALMSSHSIVNIWQYTETDVHPPLYYLLLQFVTLLIGKSAFAYRLPSALFAIGLVALGIGPISKLWSRRVGIYFSLLTMFAPSIICFAQEARMYTMATFTVTGAVVYGLLALRNNQPKDHVLFAICLITGMYTHYFALLALALLSTFLLIRSLVRETAARKWIFTSTIVSIPLYLFWVPSFVAQIGSVANGFWIPPTNALILEFSAMIPFSFKFEDIPYPTYALASMVLSLVLVGYGIFRVSRNKKMRILLLVVIGIVIGTFALGVAISAIVGPVLMPRYLLVVTGLFFLAVAIGLSMIEKQITRIGTLLLFILLMIPTDVVIYRQTFNGPFTSLIAHIESHSPDTMPIVHEDWQTLLPMRHQMPKRTHYFIVSKEDSQTKFNEFYDPHRPVVIHDMTEAFAYASQVWIIESNLGSLLTKADLLSDPSLETSVPAGHYELPYSFIKIHALSMKKRTP